MTELLAQAEEFQRRPDSGEATNRAELARQHGLTRARVTQIMNLLKLAPELKDYIQSFGPETPERLVTERKLRALVLLAYEAQLLRAAERFEGFTTGPKILALEAVRQRARLVRHG